MSPLWTRKEEQNMKYFILSTFILSLTLSGAFAQTPVTNAQAQKYYEICAKKRDERMSPKTQDRFCQCASIGYKTHITQEDLQDLGKQDQNARRVMNKILVKLYAPCMEYPVRDMVLQKCSKDAFQAGKQICGCMASKMASYISERAQSDIESILKKDPNIHDPLEAITSSPSYEQQEKNIVLQCIKGQ